MTDLAARPRAIRLVTAASLTGLALAATVVTSAPASAAAPRAQAVGRFLDGAAGGTPIQTIADLHDARASNPGTVSDQNPLDVTLFGQAEIPLSHKLQLPNGGNAVHIGAANQIASARSNGHAVGASGAVANQGGASIGGTTGRPANATIDLSSNAFPSTPLPLPGGGGQPALGGLSASIGAVSARAATPPGFGAGGTTHYSIGSLTLTLKSPALGAVLTQVGSVLTPPSPPAGLPPLPGACTFTTQALSTLSLAGGAVTVDPTTGALTIDVAALLRTLGTNINGLPANTDLLGYVTDYLASSNGLAQGLQNVLSQTFITQKQNFLSCASALPTGAVFDPLIGQLTAGQGALQKAIDGAIAKIGGAGGKHPFAPLVNGLAKALRIGVNVQPNGPRGNYTSSLRATADQADAVVPGQIIERAIEVDLAPGQGVSLALANASAGSAAPAAPAPKPTPSVAVKHNHAIPTGVPAGQGPIGGGTDWPAVLLGLGALFAGAGALTWRLGARHR